MAANFYLSSHANYHLHPRSSVLAARIDDCKHATEKELAWIEIWSGSGSARFTGESGSRTGIPTPESALTLYNLPTVIQLLCKRLGLHQQVISTAVVYFRRFYLRNSYCETDPALVAAACCYVAAKAEETPVHVKSAMAEAKSVLNEMGYATFPSDNTKLAEMEFYLIEELDFHLIVFHPYRSLLQLCGRERGEAGKAQRDFMLELEDQTLQMAWWIINDSFRTSFSVLHPPHLIALAAIYLALCVYPPSSTTASTTIGPAAHTRRQSLDTTSFTMAAAPKSISLGGKTEPITFLASLDVDHSLIMELVQEFVSIYELWNEMEVCAATLNTTTKVGQKVKMGTDEMMVGVLARMRTDRLKEVQEVQQGKRGTSWKK